VTDPTVTDPTVTDPTVTDPTVTDPTVTDPTVTDPTVTDPTVIDPTVIDPTVTDPTASPEMASGRKPVERTAFGRAEQPRRNRPWSECFRPAILRYPLRPILDPKWVRPSDSHCRAQHRPVCAGMIRRPVHVRLSTLRYRHRCRAEIVRTFGL
jgi:hypothetical protein